jgi:hypothetical protein
MENEPDPFAQFGLDAIDFRWTLKDIAAKRPWMINKQHLAKLIELVSSKCAKMSLISPSPEQNTVWRASIWVKPK